jgi:hypothetical protein
VLDIRATAYISPLLEIDFASVALTVRLKNYADETGYVTGTFRVYNDITGLLIHTSVIDPLTLAAGQQVDAPALTDFDPPAPADDTYFVIFNGHAYNDIVPRGIDFSLGQFYFDVKPVGMGPAPAAHAATHEDGGSDELEISDLGTSELDDTLVLSPDGAGGVEWKASPAGVTDHGALTGLADDDHPQYLLRPRWYFDNDMLLVLGGSYQYFFDPWYWSSRNSGTDSAESGEPNHPGICAIYSSTSANSGGMILVSSTAFLLAGGETTDLAFQLHTIAGTTLFFGYHDKIGGGGIVDGVYIQVSQVGGVDGTAQGLCTSNGASSTTASSTVLAVDTWYRARVTLNADATLATFAIYSEAGALIWSDTLAANIPTAAGRETGHGIFVDNSGTAALLLARIDFMSVACTRTLVR